ncbi:MAG: hypothetical protein KatS3mg105_0987 [Gemmatales bacterium]|nr:MAG: hypothetical protein KatS3mg105_0987 [Gemmatales bacterium]
MQSTFGNWVAFLNGSGWDYELLVASEARQSVESLTSSASRACPVSPPQSLGFGAALAACLPLARNPLVCYTRCSPAKPPENLKQLLRRIDHADLVTGIRTTHTKMPIVPRFDFRRFLLSLVFGVPVTDPFSLWALARREVLESLVLQSRGDFAHVEILAKVNFLEGILDEIGVIERDPPERITFAWDDVRRVFFQPDFKSRSSPADSGAASLSSSPASPKDR